MISNREFLSINLQDMFYKGSPVIDMSIVIDKLDKGLFKIIVGEIGIGKSSFSKTMSYYDKEVLYIEVNRVDYILKKIREKALDIIEIRSIKGGIDNEEAN